MAIPRSRERIGGVVLPVIGVLLIWFAWHTARVDGEFSVTASVLGPAIIVFGIALLLFPGYRSEREARGEDLSALTGWALLTPRWKVVFILALAAALLNTWATWSGRIPSV